MRAFDRVAALTVEGVSKSAIARLEGLSWNTVARWQALAAAAAGKFSDIRTYGYDLTELQLDGLATFLQGKKRQTWVFAAIEVWSRLWPATLSEDSTVLNTAFIERLNLTIRQGSAYLHRRSPCHARRKQNLEEALPLPGAIRTSAVRTVLCDLVGR